MTTASDVDIPNDERSPGGAVGHWAAIAVGLPLVLLGAARAEDTAPCRRFHLAVELSGSDARLVEWLGDAQRCAADLDSAGASLRWDLVLIVGYGLLLTAVIARWWRLYHTPILRAITAAMIVTPVAAAVLDVVENGLIWWALEERDGRFAFPEQQWLPVSIATVAWLKWTLVVVAIAAALASAGLAMSRWFTRRLTRSATADSAEPVAAGDSSRVGRLRTKWRDWREESAQRRAITVTNETESRVEWPHEPVGEIGVCCSGGGIRAAAFSIGALECLEKHGVMRRARWLTAVSGGSYAATAWWLVKRSEPDLLAAPAVTKWLQTPILPSEHSSAGDTNGSKGRHRFLRNGPGGLGRPVIAALAYVLFNVVVLSALVYAVAWPLGRLLGSRAVQPALRTGADLPLELQIPAALWLPGVGVLVIALAALLLSALPFWKLSDVWWKVAVALLVTSVFLELLLVFLPLLMVYVGRVFTQGTSGLRASAVGASAFAGVALSVWRLVRTPVLGRITRRLPELGGLFLALAAIVWGGKIATDAAVGAGAFRDARWWLLVAGAFVLVYVFVGTTNISIHRIYRKRLRRTFGLHRSGATVYAPPQWKQMQWTAATTDPPLVELVICCARQRTGIAPGGLPAETFTISPAQVRMGEHRVDTDDFVARLRGALRVERYVSSWMATSGAAFASAMGRLSKGSTNALLAALNIDLGIWLPNPRLDCREKRFARVRLPYLFKEILGIYDDDDRYVFVADGGHWENLGLVELLREKCTTILCIDASGDMVGAFTTLRQAVELASLELPDVVKNINLTNLETIIAKPHSLPTGIVASLDVTYKDDTKGVIHYAKAQVASSLEVELRQFAKADPMFPNYSTGDQFLTDRQFASLVDLGRAAGNELVALAMQPPRAAVDRRIAIVDKRRRPASGA